MLEEYLSVEDRTGKTGNEQVGKAISIMQCIASANWSRDPFQVQENTPTEGPVLMQLVQGCVLHRHVRPRASKHISALEDFTY